MPPRAKNGKQDQIHRFHQLLHHVGWTLTALEPPVVLRGGPAGMQVQLAPIPDGRTLALLFSKETLPELNEAFRTFEDFTPFHRSVELALRKEGIITRNAVLIDPELGTQLIDFEQEDVLLEARGEVELGERILPILGLTNLARGSLTNFPRKTPRQRARELQDWTRVWSARIGSAARTNRFQAQGFFYWLHLTRLAEYLGIGPAKRLEFSEFGDKGKKLHPVRFLESAFKPLRDEWNLLQGTSLTTQKEIAQAAHDAGELEPCLRSYAMLSRGKFASDIFAEAFADEELRITGWRHSLTEKEVHAESDPAQWLMEPLTIELDKVGFIALLRGFDRVVEDLRHLSREQAVSRQRGERPGFQMDLLGSEPPPIEEEEAPRVTLESGVMVKTERRERAEVARFVLLAHTAEWHSRLRRPDPIFPSPCVVSTERPEPATPANTIGMSDPRMN